LHDTIGLVPWYRESVHGTVKVGCIFTRTVFAATPRTEMKSRPPSAYTIVNSWPNQHRNMEECSSVSTCRFKPSIVWKYLWFASTSSPVQLRSISRNRVWDAEYPLAAPHSMKNPLRRPFSNLSTLPLCTFIYKYGHIIAPNDIQCNINEYNDSRNVGRQLDLSQNKVKTVNELFADADKTLLKQVLANPNHTLRQFLPPINNHDHHLRKRPHNHQLPTKRTILQQSNFIIRNSLFSDTY